MTNSDKGWTSPLFWQTFSLLLLLLVLSVILWMQSFRTLTEEPFSRSMAQQIVSTANLTRYALVSADAPYRPLLLETLAYNEGLRILPKDDSDSYEPLNLWGNLNSLVTEQTREALGPGTILASNVNGFPGLWISIDIQGDEYWLRVRPDAEQMSIGSAWLWWALLAGLMCIAGSLFLCKRTLDPLDQLNKAVSLLGRGKVPPPLPEDGKTTEIVRLNHTFNEMVKELSEADSNREILLAGVSHDLRTPLTRLRLEVELADLPESSRQYMVSDLEQMESIMNQFMVYAKRSDQPLERIDVGLIVNDTINDMRIRGRDDVRLETNIMGQLFVMTDGIEMTRAVQNIIVNADRYGRSAGSGLLELSVTVFRQDDTAVIRIADKGPGVPEKDMERVTRPFERGERSRQGAKGAGLGLAIVKRVMMRSNGRLNLLKNHPTGLITELVLPLANTRGEKPVLEEQTQPIDPVVSNDLWLKSND